jgi:hypothetical protein
MAVHISVWTLDVVVSVAGLESDPGVEEVSGQHLELGLASAEPIAVLGEIDTGAAEYSVAAVAVAAAAACSVARSADHSAAEVGERSVAQTAERLAPGAAEQSGHVAEIGFPVNIPVLAEQPVSGPPEQCVPASAGSYVPAPVENSVGTNAVTDAVVAVEARSTQPESVQQEIAHQEIAHQEIAHQETAHQETVHREIAY